MTDVPYWLFLFALWGFGLLFGSFANVVIWRLPRGESLSSPPSHCPSCDTPIAWYDNVPLLSWVVLRARCRTCGSRIPVRYPAVEAASGLLWLASGLVYGMSVRTAFAVVFLYVLLILTFIDLDHRRLPNPIVAFLGGAGVIGVVLQWSLDVPAVPLVGNSAAGIMSNPLVTAGVGVILGGGLSFVVASLYSLIRGKTGLGMGDVKLLGVMGLFLGPYVLMALMIGSVVGAAYGLLFARDDDGVAAAQIPFGPFLACGALASVLCGPWLWGAYAKLVGIG